MGEGRPDLVRDPLRHGRAEVHARDDERRAVLRDPVRDGGRAAAAGPPDRRACSSSRPRRRGTREPRWRLRTVRGCPRSLSRVRSSISIGSSAVPRSRSTTGPRYAFMRRGPLGVSTRCRACVITTRRRPDSRDSRWSRSSTIRRRRTASEGCMRRGNRRRRRCRIPGRRGRALAAGAAGAAARAGEGPVGAGASAEPASASARNGMPSRAATDSATDSSASSQPGAHSIALGPIDRDRSSTRASHRSRSCSHSPWRTRP